MTKNNRKNDRRMAAPTTAPTPARITQRSRDALLPFALLPTPQSKDHAYHHAPSSQLLNQIQSSPLTLITGHSGSGKTTLLKALKNQLPKTITPSNLPPINQSLPIVNLFNSTPLSYSSPALAGEVAEFMRSEGVFSSSSTSSSPLPTAHCPLPSSTLSFLSAAGLAEPKLWALPENALSTGEQARLTIARLLDRASPGTTILFDELATPLDRLTARSLCASINKLAARHPSLRIIAASAHEDLPTFLDTDLLINAADHSILPNQHTPETITYEPGTIDDYHALKHQHYIQSDPVSITQITRAVRRCPVTQTSILAGIIIIAYPTLNASWRDRAWPNRYTTSSKSANANRINTELRRITRVIVAPHSRGLGIATTLVRNYLSNPLTPATEALAAMGSISPFFKNAGMTEYPVPPSPTDLRLLDCLRHLNLTPHDLLQPTTTLPPSPSLQGEGRGEGSQPSSSSLFSSHLAFETHPLLQRELKTWARTKNLDPNHNSLPTYAAFKLLTQPRAYAHVNNTHNKTTEQRA